VGAETVPANAYPVKHPVHVAVDPETVQVPQPAKAEEHAVQAVIVPVGAAYPVAQAVHVTTVDAIVQVAQLATNPVYELVVALHETQAVIGVALAIVPVGQPVQVTAAEATVQVVHPVKPPVKPVVPPAQLTHVPALRTNPALQTVQVVAFVHVPQPVPQIVHVPTVGK